MPIGMEGEKGEEVPVQGLDDVDLPLGKSGMAIGIDGSEGKEVNLRRRQGERWR